MWAVAPKEKKNLKTPIDKQTNTTEQSPSQKTDRYSRSQAIFRI
jgi:hypothetical protein